MDLQEFVNENREEIDAAIHRACSNCQIDNDDEREQWVMNDYGLYRWAQSEGVDI